MGTITFVAWLYVAAICGFVIGAGDAYRWYEFWNDGQYGTMESADPVIARALKHGDPTSAIPADVTYVTAAGPVPVRGKYLPVEIAKRLNTGEKVPVRFSGGEGCSLKSRSRWRPAGAAQLQIGHLQCHAPIVALSNRARFD